MRLKFLHLRGNNAIKFLYLRGSFNNKKGSIPSPKIKEIKHKQNYLFFNIQKPFVWANLKICFY